MKKIKLTESKLTKIIQRVINEQEEEEEIIYVERTEFNRRLAELEARLTQLEDDYMRKIGFGDHHKAPPPL